jgi:hypothetical protein
LAELFVTADPFAIPFEDHFGRGSDVLGDLLGVLAVGEKHTDRGVPGVVKVPMPDVEGCKRSLKMLLAKLPLIDRVAALVDEDVVIGLGAQRLYLL